MEHQKVVDLTRETVKVYSRDGRIVAHYLEMFSLQVEWQNPNICATIKTYWNFPSEASESSGMRDRRQTQHTAPAHSTSALLSFTLFCMQQYNKAAM
jgi:hypothetical protein